MKSIAAGQTPVLKPAVLKPAPQDQDAAQIVRQILAKRGYREASEVERFLNPDYGRHLHDPFLLTDMEPAVERITRAVRQKQTIIIYGDYDIDGITASAVMLETITALGGTAVSYIPDRFEEGYGLNLAALKKLKKAGTDLVVSVDCGITSVKEADWARANGLDLVITDHHAVPDVIPQAVAVINPKRPGDRYPFKDLAGVGVAFKLAQALQQRTGQPAVGREKWLLDLVALGTVCDVVTLVGENRVLAKYGLMVMQRTRRAGLKALAAVASFSLSDVSSYHLGFILGPRLNAAGRLEHAARSLELLTTADSGRARTIAAELDQLNHQRRSDQAKIVAEASEQAAGYASDPMLVLASPDWSHGIVGIAAAKLVEKWRKPALVMQIMGGTAKGSARSLGNFNLVEALRAVADNFIKFGGHQFAAGFTLKTGQIERLRADLNAYCRDHRRDLEVTAEMAVDAQLDNMAAVDWPLYGELLKLEPFGTANPKPRFGATGLKVLDCKPVGREQNHLKVTLGDDLGHSVGAIGFDLAAECSGIKPGGRADAVFQLAANQFNGRTSLQLNLLALKEGA
ncbi:single-stranded-DNA-specific exonuclease RecJ [Candidatus Parcubacteria bacterium]|nr:single-stranded-DNA-specific exonuclease RecJ [Candidatus Parcubacteria bacterium]